MRLGQLPWYHLVAPFAGAWIEIGYIAKNRLIIIVAPFAGAWIEILWATVRNRGYASLPSRERGLKFLASVGGLSMPRRSLRGSVD